MTLSDIPQLEVVRVALGISVQQAWMGYFGLGGDCSESEVGTWLAGTANPSNRDHNFLAQALNDLAVDQGGDHPAAYR